MLPFKLEKGLAYVTPFDPDEPEEEKLFFFVSENVVGVSEQKNKVYISFGSSEDLRVKEDIRTVLSRIGWLND